MSDKVQLIKEEIESYKESMKGLEPHSDFRRGQITAYNQIMQFINSLPEEHNEDLDEAAQEYSFNIPTQLEADIIWKRETEQHFKDGAEWHNNQMKEVLQTEYEKGWFDMREEMMKDVVDGEYWDGSIYLDNRPTEYKDGDKVKIIIVKEN